MQNAVSGHSVLHRLLMPSGLRKPLNENIYILQKSQLVLSDP